MADIKQDIEIRLNREYEKAFRAINIKKLVDKISELVIKLVIERTQAGYDLRSRKFGGYNKSYKKSKAYKYAAKKYGTTRYSMKSTSDKLQLTGNLLSSIKTLKTRFRVGEKGVRLFVQVGVTGSKNIKKAKGLQSTTGVARDRSRYSKKSWEFMGLAISGRFAKEEKSAIQNLIAKAIQEEVNIKIRKR